MKGSNTLNLNTATMIEALQEYFDHRLTHGHEVEVTNVKALVLNNTATFEVTVREIEEQKK